MASDPVRALRAAIIALPRSRRRLRVAGSVCVVAAAPEIRPVRSVVVQSRPASDVVSLTGTVQSQTVISFAFRIDARMV